MTNVEQIINAQWILPIEPADTCLENHSIVIDQGKVKKILPQNEAKSHYNSENIFNLNTHVIMPGFVNSHTHHPMTLLRGLADDLPLMDWLNNHIWPAEKAHVGEQFMRDGMELAIAEMILSGSTCFNEHYFFPEIAFEVAEKFGIRGRMGLWLGDVPTNWGTGTDDYLEKAAAYMDKYGDHERIKPALAPHSPYLLSDESLTKLKEASERWHIPVHMHVHESESEISLSLEHHGKRPLARLEELGLLTEQFIAVHMVHLTNEEIQLVKDRGISIVTCPQSNLKLASGFCPIDQLIASGVNIALGTDGAASNNDLDMLGEMQDMAFLAKALSKNPTTLNAHQALRIATLNGAKALHLDDQIGSLTVGKSADMIAINMDNIHTQPLYHPEAQVVYAAGREQVSHVWVNGQLLLDNRQLTRMDIDALKAKVTQWQQRLLSKR